MSVYSVSTCDALQFLVGPNSSSLGILQNHGRLA